MLRSGYDIRMSAGAITAGGCLGILIPPSVMLIVYGATAGVSVVQLYAGAFFPGLMLAGLYIVYVIVLAKWKPHLAPPLPEAERHVELPPAMARIRETVSHRALPGLLLALRGSRNHGVASGEILRQLFVTLLPLLAFALVAAVTYRGVTAPLPVEDVAGLLEMGAGSGSIEVPSAGGLAEPKAEGVLQEPKAEGGLQEPPGAATPPAAGSSVQEPPGAAAAQPAATPGAAKPAPAAAPTSGEPRPAPQWFWIGLAVGGVLLAGFYAIFSFVRLEIFKMLLGSFFPLSMLILAVLGSIVFGLATPTEAAAVGAFGGFILAAAYKQLNVGVVRESVFLTAKTSAMVCWLFVGSSIFSAAFALLGGQELVEKWVLSMNLTPLQFMILSQFIIFILGWPLEWTEIIVIFMPIFIPLLSHFHIDPLFFGLLVALNLQTAFLSPPVAMAAFYLKGVSPPHVTLNQIFAGMMPFMAIQVLALILLYVFPGIGLWLPKVLYG
jgi:TRAP-type mannitol/chloroaromatic compound transport system permease large subunit